MDSQILPPIHKLISIQLNYEYTNMRKSNIKNICQNIYQAYTEILAKELIMGVKKIIRQGIHLSRTLLVQKFIHQICHFSELANAAK